MKMKWEALTIEAWDPLSLARWWAKTLDRDVMDPVPDGVEVRRPDGYPPSLFFVRVDETKPTKNRLHLDLSPEDQATAVDELIARGATRADVGQPEEAEWVVMRDPEGNEFCLL